MAISRQCPGRNRLEDFSHLTTTIVTRDNGNSRRAHECRENTRRNSHHFSPSLFSRWREKERGREYGGDGGCTIEIM